MVTRKPLMYANLLVTAAEPLVSVLIRLSAWRPSRSRRPARTSTCASGLRQVPHERSRHVQGRGVGWTILSETAFCEDQLAGFGRLGGVSTGQSGCPGTSVNSQCVVARTQASS
jgi:hypothetical protein